MIFKIVAVIRSANVSKFLNNVITVKLHYVNIVLTSIVPSVAYAL